MSDEPCRWGAVDPVAVRFAFGLLNEFMLRRDRKELRCGDVRKLRKQAIKRNQSQGKNGGVNVPVRNHVQPNL